MTPTTASPAAPGPAAGLFHSPALVLAILLLLAIALRAYAFSYWMLDPDSCQYLDLARDLARGDYFRSGYNLDQGIFVSRRLIPLYSLLTAIPYLLGLPLPASGYLVSWLADLAAVAVAFRIGRRAMGLTGATLAGLTVAFSPAHVDWANAALTESLFVLLTLAILDGALAAAREPGAKRGAALGALAALAYLTREIGLAYSGLLFLAAVCWYALPGRPSRRQAVMTAVGFGLAFALLALPFWFSVRARTGAWGLSLRAPIAEAILMPGDPDLADGENGKPGLAAKRAALFGDYLGALAPRTADNAFNLAAALLLLAASRKNRRLAAIVLGWALGLAVAVSLVGPFIFTDRYLYPARALLEVAGAVAVAEIFSWRRGKGIGRRGRQLAAWAPVLAAVAVWTISGGATASRLHRAGSIPSPYQYDRGIAEVCRELRAHYRLPARPRVMDRKPYAAFFLEGNLTLMPETMPELEETLARERVDLLFIDSTMIRKLRPGLMSLISGLQPPAGMRVVYQRYDQEFGKTRTVYGRADLKPAPVTASLEAMATALYSGDLWTARRIGVALLQQNQNDLEAHRLMAELEMVIASTDFISLPRAEAQVRQMERLAPADPSVIRERENLEHLRRQLEKVAPR